MYILSIERINRGPDQTLWINRLVCCLHATKSGILTIQCVPFITLDLGSIGKDHVISESCYKGTIVLRNQR